MNPGDPGNPGRGPMWSLHISTTGPSLGLGCYVPVHKVGSVLLLFRPIAETSSAFLHQFHGWNCSSVLPRRFPLGINFLVGTRNPAVLGVKASYAFMPSQDCFNEASDFTSNYSRPTTPVYLNIKAEGKGVQPWSIPPPCTWGAHA